MNLIFVLFRFIVTFIIRNQLSFDNQVILMVTHENGMFMNQFQLEMVTQKEQWKCVSNPFRLLRKSMACIISYIKQSL